ncbi:PREDICTED: EGF domain-specific O-linked [Prunus dulcis]|uniref:PREDICTED: EGF domain-specific O-linked n=1 Tax=Prunus dulcis TaxID=3755 RepID=A0A5E4FU22_PRUDU|nr:PREDICTED: EGF domain-specific O-linked [Prunus dulcis]
MTGGIISHLSDYQVVDFGADMRTHCFPEAIVGLRIHNELSVDSLLMEGNKSIFDFRDLLNRAYMPRIQSLIHEEELQKPQQKSSFKIRMKVHEVPQLKRPKLLVISRNGSRAITNENLIVKMAEQIGIQVKVLRPDPRTELAKIYWVLNSSDATIGVHGAAMTHFLFMRPGSVFVQVIPIGNAWAAEEYYGAPAENTCLDIHWLPNSCHRELIV